MLETLGNIKINITFARKNLVKSISLCIGHLN